MYWLCSNSTSPTTSNYLDFGMAPYPNAAVLLARYGSPAARVRWIGIHPLILPRLVCQSTAIRDCFYLAVLATLSHSPGSHLHMDNPFHTFVDNPNHLRRLSGLTLIHSTHPWNPASFPAFAFADYLFVHPASPRLAVWPLMVAMSRGTIHLLL